MGLTLPDGIDYSRQREAVNTATIPGVSEEREYLVSKERLSCPQNEGTLEGGGASSKKRPKLSKKYTNSFHNYQARTQLPVESRQRSGGQDALLGPNERGSRVRCLHHG